MKFNIQRTRKALQKFEFQDLFIDELGWNNPNSNRKLPLPLEEDIYYAQPIAQLSAALVYQIQTPNGKIPNSATRKKLANIIQKISYEHVTIFVNMDETQSIWHWLKTQNKKNVHREHTYIKGQAGDLFISKLSALFF